MLSALRPALPGFVATPLRAAAGSARLRRLATISVLLAGVAASASGVTHLPSAAPLPALLGLAAFVLGKYVFCPLRWHALSAARPGRRWFLRTYAEAELLGLCTPGHAGADIWRVRRLEQQGERRAAAVAEVAADRLVGSIGVAAFALAAGAALPLHLAVTFGSVAAGILVLALVVLRLRPGIKARIAPSLPGKRRLAIAFAYSFGYQACVVAMLLGTVLAVGESVSPLALAGVFGASQLAGVLPGPQGASPKDGALAVGLVALGLPWAAAIGAVALKALLAWVPGVAFGGASFLARRVAAGRARLRALVCAEHQVSLPQCLTCAPAAA
ncbi:lysylphosphatidylglycerol synthase domain-containing protein [Motilibacter aurantiacus]|uniref:lysylphosphatidylglycerol synthase domain-containing protein n=1 Tax=Motilibacter aurantiacus TaxID=2714955 RepID=UPI0014090128|nr:lysylphosphatidylglycerol synthase domain-containing protein [Motilibacter aurantiacus]NHC46558.1 hypothetical protein [Motilibacter aurantiacus]